jgi:hypothetical protein
VTWVVVCWPFGGCSWCRLRVLSFQRPFVVFAVTSACNRRFSGEIWKFLVVLVVSSGCCGLFRWILSSPATSVVF